ncbi:MAG: 16S rRNA (guanine(527)-N(7))-methyltransferase RsmG [Alphaproteobacteria bacterium]|nr:16S rRNA (guanine(527)-N(7))-methyltransferase RsmG [Alphaproteobacteria bacterium]
MTVAEFEKSIDVSRETLSRLQEYGELLGKWNTRINLVGRESLNDLWRRHMLDSVQLAAWDRDNKDAGPWVDLGSGAGFPGLVLAIAGIRDVHLVESDSRKCAFLREAAILTNTEVTIHNARIETLEPLAGRVVSARALAPLVKLLPLAYRHLEDCGQMLFLKGQDIDTELTEATKYWKMTPRYSPSLSDKSGSILQLTEIARV